MGYLVVNIVNVSDLNLNLKYILDLPRYSSTSDYYVRMELRRRSKKEAKISYEHIPVNKVSLLASINDEYNDSLPDLL